MLDSNGGLSRLRAMREMGTETESWIGDSTVSLSHKADKYKAIGRTSFNILTQFILMSHDSLKLSEAKPPRPHTHWNCTPVQHSCSYLSAVGSLLRLKVKVSISRRGRGTGRWAD